MGQYTYSTDSLPSSVKNYRHEEQCYFYSLQQKQFTKQERLYISFRQQRLSMRYTEVVNGDEGCLL